MLSQCRLVLWVFCVSAEPTSIALYVDGGLVDTNSSLIEYNNLTQINITCVVTGGHPQAVVAISANSVDLEPTSEQDFCRPRPSELLPAFLSEFTCSASVNVQQFAVDHASSGRPVTCRARSRGSPDIRLSASFTPHLTGGMFKPNIAVTTIITNSTKPAPILYGISRHRISWLSMV